ncbi:Hypothetical protein PHPALM_11420 [Phytophthora palmivora]|uniref:Uncharacterized protein n=1 Tax=Phytophthora palmivora TaxID=4796 RepID=A0A2P4Y2B2_9STRA|nr:Hypothetical protein PHPALM_11420 [Phytophthora palmivora]
MAPPNENRPLSLDPLHSPGSDTQEQQPPPEHTLDLSAQDTSQRNQETDTADPMAKTKRRMFSSPLLRRSATASSAAAVSAASRIKSNLSTVKLPTALKRSSANSGNTSDKSKDSVDRAPTVPSLLRSSTDTSVKKEETKMAPSHGKVFGIPSVMRKGPGFKKSSDSPLNSSERSSSNSTNNSETEENSSDEVHENMPQQQTSATKTASRFVMGMPTMLRRAVSNNHALHSTSDIPATTQKKSPDTSANSTPQGQLPEDNFDEEDRHSLLMMLQVPQARRNSQIPLMAASEAW